MNMTPQQANDPVDADHAAPTGLRLGRKIAISVILGALVIAALGIFADLRDVGTSFATFDYRMLAPVLLWTIFNYVLRWLKWDYYLRKLNFGTNVSRYDSALLFTSGMVMAVTPGKVGEVFKSYLLKRINNTPVSASAPIVLAERLTDGLAMLLLMARRAVHHHAASCSRSSASRRWQRQCSCSWSSASTSPLRRDRRHSLRR